MHSPHPKSKIWNEYPARIQMDNYESLRIEIQKLDEQQQTLKNALTAVASKKEKLILLLYELESTQPSLNHWYERLGELSCGALSSEQAIMLNLVEENVTKKITPALDNQSSSKEPIADPHQAEKRSAPKALSIIDAIIEIIIKENLNSFSVSYLVNYLGVTGELIIGCLQAEDYSKFWHCRSKSDLTNWSVNLELIRETFAGKFNSPPPTKSPRKSRRAYRRTEKTKDGKLSFKKRLPQNSTDNLVEDSANVFELLWQIFESNQETFLGAQSVLEYLYPGQYHNWTSRQKKMRKHIISTCLSKSLKEGNWQRVEVGIYRWKERHFE